MNNPSVEKGSIVVYRLFDAASYIDLSLVESMAKERPVRRLRLSKYPQVKALEFVNPPVSFELKEFTRPVLGVDTSVAVTARAYDFGVISIAFSMAVPSGTSLPALKEAGRALANDESIEPKAREYAQEFLDTFKGAVTGPAIKGDIIEDYLIFFIEELGGNLRADELFSGYDLSKLLLYETRDLSPRLREETLKHRFAYYPDDLIILHYYNAVVVEPSGNRDILDILEFANAQLLELRYYDGVLDRELNWVYSELSRRGRVSTLGLKGFEALARRMTEIVRDLTDVTEKVDNAVKVTEDVYFARVYTAAMRLFRSAEWERSIKEKLEIVSNAYRMLHNEISIKRGHILEAIIILLIAIDIVLVLAGR